MNTTISFQLGKLLKEKGFDEWSKTWFQNGDGIVGYVEGKRDYYNRKGDYYISTPTISDVVMWLYKKHGIWVWVQTKIKEDGSDDVWFIPNGRNLPIKTKGVYEIDPIPYTPKNTPTEAYESAIEHCLTKLIK